MGSPAKVFVNNRPPQCTAEDLNSYLNEINNTITGAGITPTDAENTQVNEAVIKQALSATVYQASGTDTIDLSTKDGKNPPSDYFDGMRLLFFQATENNGPVTINLNGYGAKDLKLPTGEALDAGALSGFVEIVFDEANDRFLLALQAGGGGAEGPGSNRLFYPSDQSLKDDFSLAYDKNWMMAGPLVVDAGKTLTVETGARLVVV